MTGKLDSKTFTNKKGQEVKLFHLMVAEAKIIDGKPMDALKGKNVAVAHKKGFRLAASVGKDVTISGTLVNNKRLLPESIK